MGTHYTSLNYYTYTQTSTASYTHSACISTAAIIGRCSIATSMLNLATSMPMGMLAR